LRRRSTIAVARGRRAGALAASLWLAGCVTDLDSGPLSDSQVAAKLSLGEAKEIIQREYRWQGSDGSTEHPQAALRFTPDRIEVLVFPPTGAKTRFQACPYEAFQPIVDTNAKIANWAPRTGETYYQVATSTAKKSCDFIVSIPSLERAKEFSNALVRWRQTKPAERLAYAAQEQQQFAAVVANYKAARPKPALPEQVVQYKITAENSVRERRYADAADAYLEALKIAPWWPEGHFNAALVLGEIHYYDEAIDHMKKYLALAANASGATRARAKIGEWESAEKSIR
jgi:tetratricopeptide (TPR) repeat protein